MGLNPQIPLDIRPPQVESPMQAMSAVNSFQAGIQERQLRNEQIQQAQMQTQQMVRDLQDQQTIRETYMKYGDNMDRFQSELMKAGVSPKNLFSIQQHILEMRQKKALTSEAELKGDNMRHDDLRGALEAYGQQPPEQQTDDAWKQLLANQYKAGKFKDPDEYQQFLQAHASSPDSGTLKIITNGLASSTQLNKETIDKRNADSAAKTAQARADSAAASVAQRTEATEQKQFADTVSHLASLGPDEYKVAKRTITATNPKIGALLPDEQPDDPNDLLKLAMTPAQRLTAENQAATRAETRRHNLVTEDLGRQARDTAQQNADWRQGATKSGKLTPNQFTNLMRDEGKLNRERRVLGNALTAGDTYVDRLGNLKADVKPNSTQMDDMRQRYLEATDELKKLIAAKNNHLAATGVKVGVPTDQAVASLDAGSQKVHGAMIKARPDDPGLGFGPVSTGETKPGVSPIEQPSTSGAKPTGTFVPAEQSKPAAAPAAPATQPAVSIPPRAVALLKEGVPTKFNNGQTWTLRSGKPVQLK